MDAPAGCGEAVVPDQRAFRPLLARLAKVYATERGTDLLPYGGRLTFDRHTDDGPIQIDVVFATKEVDVPVVPKEPVPRWLLPASAFALSFAGSAVSLVTMGVYFDRAADLKARCPENRCAPELEGERDTISAIGIASMVSFGVGAAAAAAGTVLIFYGPGRPAGNGVSLELAPPLQMRARF